MRNGGKKWSGSRSDAILFFFQREMEERFSRVEKAEEWEQQYYSFSSSSSKRRRRQRRRRRRSWWATAVPWAERVEKRRNCVIPLTLFRLKTLVMKYHKEEAKISSRERTERDQKHEKERKRAFFFTLFHTPNVCCFYIRTILHARFYANATF